jgi:hypothetical protein
VYNVYFHPLARIPGPKIRAAFYFPHNLELVAGDVVHNWHKLHEQYGEIVRVSPSWISTTNPDAWRGMMVFFRLLSLIVLLTQQDIYGYGNGKPIPKDPAVYNTYENRTRPANILCRYYP